MTLNKTKRPGTAQARPLQTEHTALQRKETQGNVVAGLNLCQKMLIAAYSTGHLLLNPEVIHRAGTMEFILQPDASAGTGVLQRLPLHLHAAQHPPGQNPAHQQQRQNQCQQAIQQGNAAIPGNQKR